MCLPLHAMSGKVKDGDYVVVHRINLDGLYEATCKQYRLDDGEIWLLRWSGTDSEVSRVHNPGIKEDEIHGLSDQLSDLLQGDM